MTPGRDSIEEFAGDRAGGEQLRRNLRTLAERYEGTPLGGQLNDVLAGRMTMRELAGDPEFATLASQGMRAFAEQWAAMGPEERAEVMRQGRQIEAQLEAELDARDRRTGGA